METHIVSQPHRHRSLAWRALALAACVVLIGCGHEQPLQPLPLATQAPDFSLPDVNPNSASAGQQVTPRAQIGSVSAWYFGHAT